MQFLLKFSFDFIRPDIPLLLFKFLIFFKKSIDKPKKICYLISNDSE